MQRIGFLLQVKPEQIAEYKRRHAAVWPELLAEISKAGIHNYSLFMREDGLEFGYCECEDWQAACDYLAKSNVNARWQEEMKEFLATPVDMSSAEPVKMLEQVFYLE